MPHTGAFFFDFPKLNMYNAIMKTFQTVEDYIEIISGARDPGTGKLTHSWVSEPIVSLARYDVDVINNMSEQCTNNISFTEKQANLAVRIILKYQRQLASKDIDVTPLNTPMYRNPLRQMDYSCSLGVSDNKLTLKFPYNQKLIDQVRSFTKESQGTCKWLTNKKLWEIALTEYNLNWAYAFSKHNQFSVSEEVEELYKLVECAEQQPYKIELTLNGDSLVIENAHHSLLQYINDTIGEISFDNFYKLVDNSSLLGFTVNKSLLDAVVQDHGVKFLAMVSNSEFKIAPNTENTNNDILELVKYAKVTNRYPIVLFEPDLTSKLYNEFSQYFDPSEIRSLGFGIKNAEVPDLTGIKLLHVTKPIKNINIPLLVSGAGMMFGGDKQLMQQKTEKVAYIAADIYTTSQKSKKVTSISG